MALAIREGPMTTQTILISLKIQNSLDSIRVPQSRGPLGPRDWPKFSLLYTKWSISVTSAATSRLAATVQAVSRVVLAASRNSAGG